MMKNKRKVRYLFSFSSFSPEAFVNEKYKSGRSSDLFRFARLPIRLPADSGTMQRMCDLLLKLTATGIVRDLHPIPY